VKAQVVVLTSRFPLPLIKGDRVRAYYQLKSLSKAYDVHLIAICDEQPAQKDIDHITEIVASVTSYPLPHAERIKNLRTNAFSELPLQVQYFFDKKIADMISHQISQLAPDLIYTQLIRMAPYVERLKSKFPVFIDYMDSMVINDLAGQMLDRGWRKLFLGSERRKVKAYESKIAAGFKSHYAISSRDRAAFRADVGKQIKVLPNGVDTARFHPDREIAPTYDIGFCGNLSYVPNPRAVENLLDLMSQSNDWTARVVGAEAPKMLLARSTGRIDISGFVEDMRELYCGVRVFAAPIYTGSGMQNKILEAMA